jgi:hypothetical protein
MKMDDRGCFLIVAALRSSAWWLLIWKSAGLSYPELETSGWTRLSRASDTGMRHF